MTRKYEKLDIKLFGYLAENRTGVTTSTATKALGVNCKTTERHISRRFTQLEDRGVLSCSLRGTTRVCVVITDPPASLARTRWRPKHVDPKATGTDAASRGIPAETSEQFLLAGGVVEKLPNTWDRPITQKALGAMTFTDYISTLD